jgi:hypothetical protein
MENQHRKITGYRDLGEADINAMNLIKGHGRTMFDLLQAVKAHVGTQRAAQQDALIGPPDIIAEMDAKAEIARLNAAQPERWIAIAQTHFQEGLMALTRAVAQPSSF